MTDRARSGHGTRHVTRLPLGRGHWTFGRGYLFKILELTADPPAQAPRTRDIKECWELGVKTGFVPGAKIFLRSKLSEESFVCDINLSPGEFMWCPHNSNVCWNVWELWVTTDKVMSEAKKSWLVLVSIIFCHVVLIFHVTHLCSIITDLEHETLDLH